MPPPAKGRSVTYVSGMKSVTYLSGRTLPRFIEASLWCVRLVGSPGELYLFGRVGYANATAGSRAFYRILTATHAPLDPRARDHRRRARRGGRCHGAEPPLA